MGFELITIYDIAKYIQEGQEYIAQMDAVFRKVESKDISSNYPKNHY